MRISDWSSDVCSSDLELCKIIPFLDLFCSLFAGQWWLAVGNMAEQVESAEGVAIFDLVAQSIQRDAQRLQLFDDHLLLLRPEVHTSELQSLMPISYAVFCLQKNTKNTSHYQALTA